ncbi:hypothetical protein GYMLUDRAFT_1002140 [Collybiopsis luxurians FD-317 M1]|nr:hypothetical protein GYMLUDRAFT_1002140 [Collybiopsis luxurians FD-317 M1]
MSYIVSNPQVFWILSGGSPELAFVPENCPHSIAGVPSSIQRVYLDTNAALGQLTMLEAQVKALEEDNEHLVSSCERVSLRAQYSAELLRKQMSETRKVFEEAKKWKENHDEIKGRLDVKQQLSF